MRNVAKLDPSGVSHGVCFPKRKRRFASSDEVPNAKHVMEL